MSSHIAKTIIKLFIAISLLYLLFTRIDINQIRDLISRIDPWIFLLSFLLFSLRNVFGAMRWNILLSPMGYNFPVLLLTKYYFIGIFFNFFLPTVVGGDIVRGYYLYGDGVNKKETAGSIIVERALGIMAVIIIFAISFYLGRGLVNIELRYTGSAEVTGAVLSILFIIYIILSKRIRPFLERTLPGFVINGIRRMDTLFQEIKGYQKYPGALLSGLLYSILYQVAGIISTYMIGVSVGSSTGLIYYLIFLPLIWIISMAPISINGLGVREGAFIVLFGSVGMTKEMAMTISILFLLQSIAQGMLGSVFFLFHRQKLADIKSLQDQASKD